jgi:hypothetical protein
LVVWRDSGRAKWRGDRTKTSAPEQVPLLQAF